MLISNVVTSSCWPQVLNCLQPNLFQLFFIIVSNVSSSPFSLSLKTWLEGDYEASFGGLFMKSVGVPWAMFPLFFYLLFFLHLPYFWLAWLIKANKWPILELRNEKYRLIPYWSPSGGNSLSTLARGEAAALRQWCAVWIGGIQRWNLESFSFHLTLQRRLPGVVNLAKDFPRRIPQNLKEPSITKQYNFAS